MQDALTYLATNRERFLEELHQFLAIPSVSSDPAHVADMVRCAEFAAELLRQAGINDAAVLPTAGHPVVVGSWRGVPDAPTVMIYGHYDVQPADPYELWHSDPFAPFVDGEYIIARGATDNKGQLFMHIKVIEALLATTGTLPVNVVFLLEGEEEVSSTNLPAFLQEHQEALRADLVVISDSGMYAKGQPTITTGLRGLCYLEVIVQGPNRDLHSGIYGGAVANPAEILCRLIAQAKDADGRILIPGIYDDVAELSYAERRDLARVPFDEMEYKADLDVAELWGEAGYTPPERTGIRPTFEVNGIWGGFTGVGAKTVLPAVATAKVSCRLVPDQQPEKIAQCVEAFFRAQAPQAVTITVVHHSGGYPVVTPNDLPALTHARRALTEAFGKEPYLVREGGSVPIVADFRTILGMESLLIGFCLPEARIHSPNESFHLPTAWTGMEALVRLYQYMGE
ncbi:dipeptidase [Chrysiogenes arsenatis]|uniref:dipeptidase n=1 Tax=Chrysiogenes arsenatis TaxID=309797 RepID=UPI000417C867|nr:dipeptidase [Chrysiogenes arsenatis]